MYLDNGNVLFSDKTILSHKVVLSHKGVLSHKVSMASYKVSMVSYKVVLSHKVVLSCQALWRSAPGCEPVNMWGLRIHAATLAPLLPRSLAHPLSNHREGQYNDR